MSQSKLESLPNEILCDIFENYINGVDILTAFYHQLNQRFDAIIFECRRFRFNFIRCRKEDFRFCQRLLPLFTKYVEELSISEQETPGQVHDFLSVIPSLGSFERLVRFYFHFDGETVNWDAIERILKSLSATQIETISIKAMNVEHQYSFRTIIAYLFRLQSLKRLSLQSDLFLVQWDFLPNSSTNIEYLTIAGIGCELLHLQNILQTVPHLKYLDIYITSHIYIPHGKQKIISEKTSLFVSRLRTLILTFEAESSITLEMLAEYFNLMPALTRLDVKAHSGLANANSWQTLLKTTLPSLTQFCLRTTLSRIKEADLYSVLASFQTPYWLSKKNFNITISKHKPLNFNSYNMNSMKHFIQSEFDLPIVQYWIAPKHTAADQLISINSKLCLRPFDGENMQTCSYYFENVECLVLDKINNTALSWIKRHINCSRIIELIITTSQKGLYLLTSLLACFENLNTLCICYDRRISNIDIPLKKDNRVKYLDISQCEHNFSKDDILLITRCFPYLEHLKINTPNLQNVPMLKKCLLYLRTLTFDTERIRRNFYSGVTKNLWQYDLRKKVNFLFEAHPDAITIWMDEAVFDNPFWQTYGVKALDSTITSMSTSNSKNPLTSDTSQNAKKKKKLLFLSKLFK